MADQTGLGSIGVDMTKINPYGASDEQLQTINDALEKNISALQNRYAQPNWFKVAAGFAKPQLGGFIASLGSANEALGENLEKQRESEIPIAQMRSQLALGSSLLSKRKNVSDDIAKWKVDHKGQLPSPAQIAEWAAQAPDLPAVAAMTEQQKTAAQQQDLQIRAQENALRAAQLEREFGITVPGMGAIESPTSVTGAPSGNTQFGNKSPTKPTEDPSSPIPRIESGNTPGAVNPKSGATGAWQVMPRTSQDPGFGVIPARDNSDAEMSRVGQDYFNAMLNKYQGNDKLAAIAYNYGPAKTDKWLANGANWKDLPAETRDYVGQYGLLRDMPEAKPAAESGKEKSPKILSGGEIGYSPLTTQSDAAKLKTASDEQINTIYAERYKNLESVGNSQNFSQSQNAIDQMIKTLLSNSDLARRVTNPLAKQGGIIGGILNAADAGLGFGISGFAGNIQLPVLRSIVGSFDPDTERPYYDLLNTQAAKIALIQQSLMNVNPNSINSGEVSILKNASVSPNTQGANVMLYNLYYTKLNNEMLHEMYSKANAIIKKEDSEYQLNPNSRRPLMDVLSSSAMTEIAKSYDQRFSKLNEGFLSKISGKTQ